MQAAGGADPWLRRIAYGSGACSQPALWFCQCALDSVRRHAVKLPNLPEIWRGRTAVLMTDLHLGNVNGVRFSRRMARMASNLKPDIVFLPGDLFDGVHGRPGRC